MPPTKIMMAEDLQPLSDAPPGLRIAYGSDPLQFGELSLPECPSPWPVIVNVHGGCWLAEFSIDHTRAQARALASAGFAVWNVEYRRVGNAGGGWPGTFLDVAMAADHLRSLAVSYPLDLNRVCLMGHSAGGHLALWLAARHRLARSCPLYVENPLPVSGVVALAPASELFELHDRGVFDGVVGKLMGGAPTDIRDRYEAVTPACLAPIGVPQILIAGRHDDVWGWNAEAYLRAALAAGDRQVRLEVIESAGHFEVIAPDTAAWPRVVEAVRGLV
jgi:acetyl esterase/lipase